MAGLAALRAGAGLVTVACPESALASIASHTAELMTEPLPETASGEIARAAFDRIAELAGKRTLVAIGPGIGTDDETREIVLRLFAEISAADGDRCRCAELPGRGRLVRQAGALRVLTPHPGEMSRLTGRTIPEIQADRIASARSFAAEPKRGGRAQRRADADRVSPTAACGSIRPARRPWRRAERAIF